MSAGDRSDILHTLARLLKENARTLAELISKEAGKPISYALTEVERSQTTTLFAAEEAKRFSGEVIPMDFGVGEGKIALTRRFPVGVIGCISPFNFPLNLALHKIAPAIAVGCSVVLKPSPYAPLSVFYLKELLKKTELPEGAVNIMMSENDVAEILVTDERISMLSFTGSPQVGWKLKSLAGKKKVALELGGNAAVVVDRDTDIDDACSKIATGAFLYSGQICISTQRVYCHQDIYDKFQKTLISKINALSVGDPFDEKTIVGPLIDRIHLERIEAWIEHAKSKGSKVLCGGSVLDREKNIYAPTLLTDVEPALEVCSEEIFGPVAIIEKVKDLDEGIEKINQSKFGLQAGVFTNSLCSMKYAFSELEVGGVMINNIPGFRIDHMPYGGVKESGFGREGLKYAMEEMTEPRLLVF